MKDFLTTVELGKMAGTSPDYIRQVILSGKLKALKAGQVWVIPKVEADKWLESRKPPKKE